MKALKIAMWLGMSFAFGKGLNSLFSPSEVMYSSLLFAAPFILMGFQQDLKTTRSSLGIFGKKIRTKSQTVKITTFCVIPIGQPEPFDSVDEWFSDTTPEEALEGVSLVTQTLVGSAVKGILTGAASAKSLSSSR
jgi:hypothetical protein